MLQVGGSDAQLRIPLSRLQDSLSQDLSLVDYEEGDVVCPQCHSKNVEQRWSAFSVITPKKSA